MAHLNYLTTAGCFYCFCLRPLNYLTTAGYLEIADRHNFRPTRLALLVNVEREIAHLNYLTTAGYLEIADRHNFRPTNIA